MANEGEFPKIDGDILYGSEVNEVYLRQVEPPSGNYSNVIMNSGGILKYSDNFIPNIITSGVIYKPSLFSTLSGGRLIYKSSNKYEVGSNWNGSIVQHITLPHWFESNDYINYCSGVSNISGDTINLRDGDIYNTCYKVSAGSTILGSIHFKFDLGSSITCSKFFSKIKWDSIANPPGWDFAIDSSNDDSTWNNIYYKTGIYGNNFTTVGSLPNAEGQTFRYIRARNGSLTDTSPLIGSYYELYIWGAK